MKLKQTIHPRRVYDGCFETWFICPFVHGYADFKGRETPRAALCSLCAWLVITMGIAGILMGQVGLLGPEAGFWLLGAVGGVWLAVSAVPLAALAVRASRGAGGKAPAKKPKLLGVDIMLAGSAALFFVLGLLMMLTTVNSGVLDPNAGMTDEPEPQETPRDYVREEPIFTYQDETPAPPAPDTMADLEEEGAVAPEESFDPAVEAVSADAGASDTAVE